MDYFFGTYALILFLTYLVLFVGALIAVLKFVDIDRNWSSESKVKRSKNSPGISIIAPAFNEAITIIDNVRSLLTLHYSRYEIIIVNDGSTDNTIEKLIKEFELVKIPDYYLEYKVACSPIHNIYRSYNLSFRKLTVVDKVNGGKADAINAGLNVASFPYIVSTDVDSVLANETLDNLIQPVLSSKKRVIAVGATLRMSNSCIVDSGKIEKIKLPENYLVRFQEMEYIRAYLLGKMGWSRLNAVPNVSGALGLFDKEILIGLGGYDITSLGEDMEILIRMCRYSFDNNIDYAVKYIPKTLCWTEGPDNIKTFVRQRVRWSRGLFQVIKKHWKLIFNPSYKRLGLIVMPYNLIFEFLAPIVELLGVLYLIYMVSMGLVDWEMAILLLVMVYVFSVFMTTYSILLDHLIHKYYNNWYEVGRLCIAALLEPFVYHPILVYSSLKGIVQELRGKKHTWGVMTRKGTAKK